jgi:hypothetical protein
MASGISLLTSRHFGVRAFNGFILYAVEKSRGRFVIAGEQLPAATEVDSIANGLKIIALGGEQRDLAGQ